MEKGRRFRLKEKEIKNLLERIKFLNPTISDFIGKDSALEVMEIDSGIKIFLLDEKPAFIEYEGEVFPTLSNEEVIRYLPSVTVDTGAIRYVCNGADVMAPGVVKIEGDFNVNSFIAVHEEKFSKTIAIAKALYDSNEMKAKRHGKIAKNVHYVSDKFWNFIKK